jgi:four helix bundle protein
LLFNFKNIFFIKNDYEFREVLKTRTKQFALRNIKLFQVLPKTDEARILGKQLLRSATSVAVNYGAACRARSARELFAKISIVVKEADECECWIDLMKDAQILAIGRLDLMHEEAIEIMKLMATIRSKSKHKPNE